MSLQHFRQRNALLRGRRAMRRYPGPTPAASVRYARLRKTDPAFEDTTEPSGGAWL